MTEPEDDTHPEGDRGTTDDGVPVSGSVVPDRFSSDEVFQRIVADADHEITSGARELFFAALAGGFAITITLLVYASMYPQTDSSVVAALLYPIGFIYIIIGGYQLYTENTLPPVALTLERLASVPALLRHWTIVALGNFAGGAIGAVVLAYGGVLSPEAGAVAVDLAATGVYETTNWELFFRGGFAGLIVAGVVWMNFAAQDTISRLVVVYLAFLTIPLGNLNHSVVSFTEAVYLMLVGDLGFLLAMTDFVIPVLVGNTVGGVVLVTVVNYYQTTEERLETARFENVRRLSIRESLLGSLAGRSYVPMFDTVEEFVRDPDSYRILVPITNPRTETRLVEMACALASTRKKGVVHVVHMVQIPSGPSHGKRRADHDRISAESNRLLGDVRDIGERYEADLETSTLVTHRSFEDVFDRANRTRPDLVMMGWADDGVWASARAERPIDELTNRLPCDFIVVKDRGLDASRVLVPTAGGPNSVLSADVARGLSEARDAEVSLLHVVDGPADRERGERFLAEWAAENGLEDADRIVDDSGDVEDSIERAAEDNTIVLIGATEQGLLSRLVTDSLHMNIADDVEASLLLAERPSDRTLLKRLVGAGRRDK
ncbi:formate/nitrite transporter family protein (plasmid) [Halobaculum sp. CBA1158]|uniref:formate/nitrite transporter family protein n=1 Tax=Halobaculum sp. CBA1158 TaxID=2904243 RepID=UPI001F441688|nr:formate/nitrite transporter family protein [Halobaculum sp. CBA1158]UIP01415.1 formate/nitrite transporter family protein [Halobaculum sp. CBA1158]